MLVGNWTTKNSFAFPPRLTSVSALPVKTGNIEVACSHWNVGCCFAKRHRNIL